MPKWFSRILTCQLLFNVFIFPHIKSSQKKYRIPTCPSVRSVVSGRAARKCSRIFCWSGMLLGPAGTHSLFLIEIHQMQSELLSGRATHETPWWRRLRSTLSFNFFRFDLISLYNTVLRNVILAWAHTTSETLCNLTSYPTLRGFINSKYFKILQTIQRLWVQEMPRHDISASADACGSRVLLPCFALSKVHPWATLGLFSARKDGGKRRKKSDMLEKVHQNVHVMCLARSSGLCRLAAFKERSAIRLHFVLLFLYK